MFKVFSIDGDEKAALDMMVIDGADRAAMRMVVSYRLDTIRMVRAEQQVFGNDVVPHPPFPTSIQEIDALLARAQIKFDGDTATDSYLISESDKAPTVVHLSSAPKRLPGDRRMWPRIGNNGPKGPPKKSP